MFHRSKLKNGITLLTVPVKGTRATTVMAMFPIGSRYETPEISGISHFVEHMLFKGTKKRPSALELTRIVDAVGAEYNAFTYKDYTGYYIKIDSHKQELAFDLIADMLFHSLITAEELEKEKGAIVEEIRMYKDNPSMAIDILSDQLVFGNNPLGWDIGGSEATVRATTRETIWGYYQRHYSARNLVLVAAGDVQNPKMKKLLRYFEGHAAAKNATPLSFYKNNFKVFNWPKKTASLAHRVAVEERAIDQAQLIINFPGLKNNDPRRYALSVLLTVLGGGMSSRLFIEIREKRGLAYMIRAGSSSFRDTGLCYVQAGLDPSRIGEALKVIKEELRKVVAEGITDQELRDAKTNITGRLALHMEDSSAQAEWYAKQFFFTPKMQTPEEVVKKISRTTAKQVQQVAKDLLNWNEMRLAAISPLSKQAIMELIP